MFGVRVVFVCQALCTQHHLPSCFELVPQGRIHERIVEETIDVPVPQVMKEVIEVVKVIPHEPVQNRTVEHIVDVSVPQIQEELLELIQLIP